MKRILLTMTVLSAFAIASFGQQDRIFTHWMFEKMNFNPGATAIKGNICGSLIYRNQWDKWSGAPNSISLGLEGAVSKWNSGFGLAFTHDAIGFSRENKLYVNYSFHLPISAIGGTLGMGVGLGFVNNSFNANWVPPTNQNDVLLTQTSLSGIQFDANFGVYLNASNWYVGVSGTQLPGLRLNSANVNITKLKQHIQVVGGYTFENLGGSDIDLQPQARIATEFTKVTFDVNAMVTWNKMVYGGLSYRFEDAVGIMVGMNMDDRILGPSFKDKNIMIGYSYDIPANKTLTAFNRGTHEIFLRFCMMPPKKPITKSVHPRWL